MKLSDLLEYNDIVIQCHDNPDADALASGYAIWWYFRRMGKDPKFIYRGRKEITKSNLQIMLVQLQIPVSYEPDFDRTPELLITVDCQAGQKNVTDTPCETLAIIDHHQVTTKLPPLSEVYSSVGSCSTVAWSLIKQEGLDVNDLTELSTALYYGLYTDTNKLSEVSHPLDRDMIDDLKINKPIVTAMVNSNISLEELKITGKAILGYEYIEKHRALVIEAEPCDPCILGVISDFSLETECVDICVAFYDSPEEVKFSVRSCTKEVHANELAAFLADGYGGGGGHILKAGGTLRPELLPAPAKQIIHERLEDYYVKFEIMYAKDTVLDTTKMKRYRKIAQPLGAVKLTDVFDEGTPITVRTLEGDVDFVIEDFTYLMIGVAGEVYPISYDKLIRSYKETNFKFNAQVDYEYEPSIINRETGAVEQVLPYAKTVLSNPGSIIYAKPLDHALKLFTAWADENYYSGKVGDYIVVRQDDEHDIYIVNGNLFDKFYEPA